ncbi:MAG: cyclodeaminase/cyclohydrolase family protein, partial [Bacteroidota bacterium]
AKALSSNPEALILTFKIMEAAFSALEVVKAMAEHGNPNSVTDAGVGALCIRSAVMGAALNVKINASGLDDKAFADNIVSKADAMIVEAKKEEERILEIVQRKMSGQ